MRPKMEIPGIADFTELDNLLDDIFEDVLRLFIRCYDELVINKEKFIKKDIEGNNYEDFYRNKLVIDYLPKYSKFFGLESLEFIPGPDEIDPSTYISKGNPDIKIINVNYLLKDEFRFNRNIYFTFECKRFGKNATPNLYITKGMQRFVEIKGSGFKYASNLPFAGMIGFIEKGDPNDIVIEINDILNSYEKMNTITNLTKESIEKGFEHSYCSKHARTAKSFITLHHLMCDYSDIVH